MKTKLLLASAFAVALGCYVVQANAQEKTREENRGITISRSETNINVTEDGHRYRIRMEGSKIVEMYKDGKEVPASDYPQYEPMVKRLMEQAEKDRARAEKDREEAEVYRKEAEQHRLQAQKDREQAEVYRKQAEIDRQEAEKHRQEAEKDRQRAEKDRALAEKHREQAAIDRQHAEEDRKLMNAMLDEIVSEKLVENRDAIKTLTLDEKEFIINNTKQSDAMHQQFKSKYLKKGQGRLRYSNSGSFHGLSIE